MVRRLCCAVLLLLAFTLNSVGQEPPKPVLLDEHGSLPCDDLIGRLDIFFRDLSKSPGSVGLVVISTPAEKNWWAVFRRDLIEAHARDRSFTSNQIKYVKSSAADEFTVQLWQVPRGAAEPTTKHSDITFEMPDDIKPFRLGVEYTWADGICPEVDDQPIFAQFLKSNPASLGNIVVRDRSIKRARRKAERIRSIFRTKYGITSSRLRFFTRTASRSALMREPIVEYWYLP